MHRPLRHPVFHVLMVLLTMTGLAMTGLAAPARAAAYSDLYSVRFKAWIPQSSAIGTTAGMTSTCQPWPTATVRFNGNAHRTFADGSGAFKTMVQYDFRWNGSRMSDVAVVPRYGTTSATMTNVVTGSQCTMSKQASGRSRVEAVGAAGAKLVLDAADPFYPASLIPNLNGSIQLGFNGRDHLTVDASTRNFPSYAYEVWRNGALVATVQILDANCTDLTGPQGVLATAQKLATTYDNPLPRQNIDTRGRGQNYFQPCDAGYSVQPLTYPATTATPTPPPGNRAPVASFSYRRVNGPGGQVALNGMGSRDVDGRITGWTWFNGTTRIASGATPTVALGVGAKQIRLVVKDNVGGTGSLTKSVSVVNRAPVIRQTTPTAGTTSGSNTPTLSALATDDDGDRLRYSYRVTGPQVDLSSGWVGGAWTVPAHELDPGQRYAWTVAVRDPAGAAASASSSFTVASLPTASDVISTPTGDGYWQVASDGGVFSYGDARFYGSVPGLGLRLTNITDMARTPSGRGYWLVGADGGVFAFGDAGFFGSLPGLDVRVTNIVGMVPTRSGGGYWLVGSDGGVFAFGDAPFHGSMGGKPLNAPVTGMAATVRGGGYWLVARDGGVFSFGDASFYGSMGGRPLNAPVADMDVTPSGAGYWLTAEDGGVFAFGDAPFHGSVAGQPLNGHITGMSSTVSGRGYWLNGCDGGIFTFGDARFHGSNATYQCRGT